MSSMGIFDACRKGDLAVVKHALCCGVNPNSYHQGQTPLMYACECGHAAIALMLIANGANIDALDIYDRTALHMACKNGHLECAKALVEAGARNDIQSNLGGETATDIVKMRGSIEMVRLVVFSKRASIVQAETKSQPAPVVVVQQPVAETVAAPQKQEEREVAAVRDAVDEQAPAAASFPRHAPAPEVDELRKLAPLPVAEK